MYNYKVKGELVQELTIPGFGMTVNGEISSRTPIENPNLELVSSPENNQVEASQPAPGHVNGVIEQNQQPTPVESEQI